MDPWKGAYLRDDVVGVWFDVSSKEKRNSETEGEAFPPSSPRSFFFFAVKYRIESESNRTEPDRTEVRPWLPFFGIVVYVQRIVNRRMQDMDQRDFFSSMWLQWSFLCNAKRRGAFKIDAPLSLEAFGAAAFHQKACVFGRGSR